MSEINATEKRKQSEVKFGFNGEKVIKFPQAKNRGSYGLDKLYNPSSKRIITSYMEKQSDDQAVNR